METLRWKQRFENLKRAYAFLVSCMPDAHKDDKSDAALVKAYEMAFELSWKTMQDFMRHQGMETLGGRDAVKAAFQYGVILDGQTWLDMLDERNSLVHIYDHKRAKIAVDAIVSKYSKKISEFIQKLETTP